MPSNPHEIRLPNGSKIDLTRVSIIGRLRKSGKYNVTTHRGNVITIDSNKLCRTKFSTMCKEVRGHQLDY